jgi:ElaB/YqjD/DUF883 family membrane-anchored ribosome-binding protein
MAHDNDHKSSAELQREVEMQRNRVESTIDQIQDKLSPGQLVDELLNYAKGGGGSEFVAGLRNNVTANPLPVALLGVSLAWLMIKPASSHPATPSSQAYSDLHDGRHPQRGYAEYPVAIVEGTSGLRRTSVSSDEHGNSYSHFADDAGKTYRALTDKAGKRAGHFMDETGNQFRGFTNAAGEQVTHFRDEAGNLLEEASDWASHTWQKAREMMHDARDAVASGASAGRHSVAGATSSLAGQMDGLNRTLVNQFRDQPLVGGALAFAVGAALGSALPHTRQEDELLGDAADSVKEKVGEAAGDLYEQGREKATDLYGTVTEKAGEIYKQARDGAGSTTSTH